MKTLDDIRQALKSESIEPAFPDGRNLTRLATFFDESEWESLGFTSTESGEPHTATPYTRESVLAKLKDDLDFAFEKALGQRGISSAAMFSVIKTWMWVLDDELQSFDDYAQYGLPLYKAVAETFGFENQIGDDSGRELKYAESY